MEKINKRNRLDGHEMYMTITWKMVVFWSGTCRYIYIWPVFLWRNLVCEPRLLPKIKWKIQFACNVRVCGSRREMFQWISDGIITCSDFIAEPFGTRFRRVIGVVSQSDIFAYFLLNLQKMLLRSSPLSQELSICWCDFQQLLFTFNEDGYFLWRQLSKQFNQNSDQCTHKRHNMIKKTCSTLSAVCQLFFVCLLLKVNLKNE